VSVETVEIDPSNWSKIERGLLPPPDDENFLNRIAAVLALGGEQRVELADMDSIARGQIPADLKDDEILAKMPAFFRAIRGQEDTGEDFEKLILKGKIKPRMDANGHEF